ncbi:hypothetical protein [Tropicibacter sp. S64]|uniref:hypothetical protein n=1 Tax=Tropicibacter sp. S64 TaxID=3415122 RepID=UPI003C798105
MAPIFPKVAPHRRLGFCILAVVLPCSAGAQDVHAQNTTIYDHLCIGADCLNPETYPNSVGNALKLKSVVPGIEFQDTSSSTGYPSTDWKIQANGASADNQNQLLFLDNDVGRAVLALEAGARSNALFVSGQGAIGVGTSLPQSEMTLYDSAVNGFGTALELIAEDTTGSVIYSDTARIAMGASLFGEGVLTILGGAGLTAPVSFALGAPTDSLRVTDTGGVGLGAFQVDTALHVERGDGTAGIKVENNSSSSVAVREMFNMTNNGGSYFTLANTASGTTWYFTHEQASPNRFIVTDGVADGPEMTLTAEGDLTVQGEIFTTGSCTAGCDRVFDADYPLPSIPEHAAMMKTLKHLPNVGPTPEDGPFNITQMTGGMLNELEKAHLYIAELEERDRMRTAEAERMNVRIARLEALVETLAAR